MLQKKNRATKHDIQNVSAKSMRHHSLFFTLQASEYQDKNTRVAIVVSKKISLRAVVRNRIQRRVRHILSHEKLPQGVTLIFYTKKTIIHATSDEIKKDIIDSLQHIEGAQRTMI